MLSYKLNDFSACFLHIHKLLEQCSGFLFVVLIKKCRVNNCRQFLAEHDPRLLGIKNAALPFSRQADDKAQINGIVIEQNAIPAQHFLAQGNGAKRTAAVFAAILLRKPVNAVTKTPDQKIGHRQFALRGL